MRTPQDNTIQELGYTLAIPLAYCKEGQAEQVKLNIQNALKTGQKEGARKVILLHSTLTPTL